VFALLVYTQKIVKPLILRQTLIELSKLDISILDFFHLTLSELSDALRRIGMNIWTGNRDYPSDGTDIIAMRIEYDEEGSDNHSF